MQRMLAKARMEHPDPQGGAGLWLVKGPHAPNARMNCKYGIPVANGDLIRLEHINTQHNLHVPESEESIAPVDGSPNQNWRILVEDGGPWKEGSKVMLIHDNTNNNLRICIFNKALRINVVTGRETASWWITEVFNPSWKVPFYTLEPLNHDLEVKPPFVVYGSGICLQHVETHRNLSSERDFFGINHFSASNQQQLSTVLAISEYCFGATTISDSNQQQVSTLSRLSCSTVWVVKGPHKQNDRYNFTPKLVVRSGDIIRLEHYNTQTNIHSHTGHRSAVTKQQEVTCYGNEGLGDSNDNFRVEVAGGDGVWGVNSHVRLVHVNTGSCLHSHDKFIDKENGEVTASNLKRDGNDLWVVVFLELLH